MDIPRNATSALRPSMDIPRRKSVKGRRQMKYAIYALGLLAVLAVIKVGFSRFKPAAPTVERATVWIDTVKRGEMLREIKGSGTLVSEQVRVVAASSEGRVERILVQPGAVVTPDTVLLELSNPASEQAAVDAEYQTRAAEADANNLRVKLEGDRMNLQASTATLQSEYSQAKLQLDTDETLGREGLVPALTLKLSRVRVQELANRLSIEQKRLSISGDATKAQLSAQQARLEQFRALAKLKRTQVESLQVRAGTSGVLQQLEAEVGQQVTPGTNLARVADPSSLKAELKIPEVQAKDIQLGQPATIDTRNGIVRGSVLRIDPSVREGTVTVDVSFVEALPQGARPDLSVDGAIQLEKLNNVVYVGRPSLARPASSASLFKLEPDGQSAVRVQVKFGRTSANTIEVLEGLQNGDQVILSDTSAWDGKDRILLK